MKRKNKTSVAVIAAARLVIMVVQMCNIMMASLSRENNDTIPLPHADHASNALEQS